MMNLLTKVILLVLFLIIPTACNTGGSPPSARVQKFNSPKNFTKPTVLMISIDGFRHDYMEMYKPETLSSWAQAGVLSKGLVPSFPSLTFPNHMSLITGLRPGHHGIVGNKFYDEKRREFYSMRTDATVNDSSWYRGTPLWAATEKSGMLSATCFWVGSEARIAGVHPTYLKPYDGQISNEQRVTWIEEWLTLPENVRPHFISLYFSDVDSAGHTFGPDSSETKAAVLNIDKELGKLKRFIEDKNLDVQIIVVSDHGMKNIDQTVDITAAQTIKKLKSSGRGAQVTFYSDNATDIEQAYKELKSISGPFNVYKANEYPKRWQLDDPYRKGDIIVVGNPGVYISFQEGFLPAGNNKAGHKATHGWDATLEPELHGLFIAHGSLIKKSLVLKPFDNVHIYPLVEKILELDSFGKIDGDINVLKNILIQKDNP